MDISTENNIKKIMEQSYMYLDDDDGLLTYSTRDNRAGYETAGIKDRDHALLMKKKIKGKHPDIGIDLDVVDEWVSLTIFDRKEDVSNVT